MTNTFNRNDGTFAQVDYASVTGTPTAASTDPTLTNVTNSTTADISLTSGSSTTFVTGPSVAISTSAIYFASGTVTFRDPTATPFVIAKLWDGTSVVASGISKISGAGTNMTVSLSGVLTNPSTNIKISAASASTATLLAFNVTGTSKDCTLTVIRIG